MFSLPLAEQRLARRRHRGTRRSQQSRGKVNLERLETRQLLATFAVENTLDSGAGSLRQAIINANAQADHDDIVFQIPGTGIQSILLLTPLPTITRPVTIDGETQDPTATAPLIEIDGASAGASSGLRIASDNVTVRRLAIVGFADHGILVQAEGTSAVIVGNYIGLRADGVTAAGNGGSGVYVSGAGGVQIGAPGSSLQNIISGNQGAGVSLDVNATGNLIVRNLIGVGASGITAIPNALGVEIKGGASFNTVGGTLQGDGNAISGNTGDGITITDAASVSNLVVGNSIGTNSNGTVSVGNGGAGISITGAGQTRIGGVQTGEGNTISSNGLGTSSPGIDLVSASSTFIAGNRIGTNPAGLADLGNGGAGILIRGGSTRTRVGGVDATFANAIAFNGRSNQAAGIVVLGDTTVSNQFLSNSIYSNRGLGIDLGGDGVTNNDGGDVDTGPNELVNFPTITNAATGAGQTLIQGTLTGAPNGSFLVQFFASDERDPTNNGEGQTFIGSTIVSTNSNGAGSYNVTLTTPTVVGQFVSATATSVPTDSGNTSEFSIARAVTQASVADLFVTVNDAPDPAVTGSTLTYTVLVTNKGPDAATNVQYSQGVSSTVTITSVTSGQGSISIVAGGVSGTLGTIPAGGTVQVVVRVVPSQIGPITTNVQVFSGQIDPNPSDNSASSTTTITNPTNLVLTASPEASPITIGDDLIFQVLVANVGNFAGTNVQVLSEVPANVNVVGVFVSQGSATLVGNKITANLQSIPVGSAVAVRVILSTTIPGNVQQTFEVVSNEIDTEPGNNVATATATVLPDANLDVTLGATLAEVHTGQTITFVANARNKGPAPATNVELQGSLPVGLTPLSGTVTDLGGAIVGTVSINGQTVLATIPSLPVGETAFVRIIATPDGAGSGPLTTSFAFLPLAQRDQGDSDLTDDSASIATNVDVLDLQVSQFTLPTIPLVGVPLVYHIDAFNGGNAVATGVVITNTYPANVTYVAGSEVIIGATGTVSVNQVTRTITATITGPIALGSAASLEFSVIPTTAVAITNVASAVVDQFDVNTGNNSSTLTSVVSPADLAVSLADASETIVVGANASPLFQVLNNGPAVANATTLTVNLPANLTVVSVTPSRGTFAIVGNVLTVSYGDLAVNELVTLDLDVQGALIGAFPIAATVSSTALDNVASNNSATFALDVINPPGTIDFSSASFTVNENAGTATVIVTRANGSGGAVSANYTTTTGSAAANVNFTPVSGTVFFAEGVSSASFDVPVLVDGRITGPLSVGLQLSSPTGGALLGSQSIATLVIANTDTDAVAPSVTNIVLLGPGATIGAFVLQFNEALDATRATDPANYQLTGPNGQFIPIFQPSYTDDLNQVTISPANPLPGGGFYRILVNGSTASGVTDVVGNLLAGGDFTATFGRGTNLSFIDSDGDRVNLRLQRGGVMEIFREADGDSQVVRLINVNRRSTLTGNVKRTSLGGNGQTNLGVIQGATFGRITSRLTSPPFFVNSQFGPINPPVQINAARRLAARRRLLNF